MKKSHLILLIIAFLMALFSIYSLAAINQVYKIDFEWYSQYNKKYISEYRETSAGKWQTAGYPRAMGFHIITDRKYFDSQKKDHSVKGFGIPGTFSDKYILMYCSLGEVDSPEYGIKFTELAQRGNVVEIKVSMNSPIRAKASGDDPVRTYFPEDAIRIDRAELSVKGELYFIFKNQDGQQLYEVSRLVK